MKRYKTVEDYLASTGDWEESLHTLREILLSTDVQETVKWGMPVYTVNNKNIAGIGAFKSYIGLWFFQGALLADTKKKLVNAQEGKTKAMRQWRFGTKDEISKSSKLIVAYINEAIENQLQGREIKPQRKKSVLIPPELKAALGANKKISASFEKLTPGKQREYAEYISEAKREETKQKRIEKIKPMILAGVGLNDKYK